MSDLFKWNRHYLSVINFACLVNYILNNYYNLTFNDMRKKANQVLKCWYLTNIQYQISIHVYIRNLVDNNFLLFDNNHFAIHYTLPISSCLDSIISKIILYFTFSLDFHFQEKITLLVVKTQKAAEITKNNLLPFTYTANFRPPYIS